jgi:hypothetical protein
LAQVGLDPTVREDDAAASGEEGREMLNRLQQEEILRQVKRILALQKRNRSSVLSSRMTEKSEQASNKKALEDLADFLKEF